MSKFFKNFNEEKEEKSKKTATFYYELEESKADMSKKEKKNAEYKAKVDALIQLPNKNKNDAKQFDKQMKKLMGEIKKYSAYFAKNEIPDYVNEWFNDHRVQENKQMKKLVDNFIEEFVEEEDIESQAMKQVVRNNTISLDDIFCIEDENRKISLLEKFLDESDTERLNVIIPLFIAYFNRREVWKMIDVLEKAFGLLDDSSKSRIIIKNLDKYFGRIYDLLDDSLESDYVRLLDKMEQYSKVVCYRRKMQLLVFKYKKVVKSDDFLFKIIYLTRIGETELAKNEWNSNFKNIFEILKEEPENSYVVQVIYEYAMFLYALGSFKETLDIFIQLRDSKNVKVEIYSLCVILAKDLVGSDILVEFLSSFRSFSENIFILESEDPIKEIFRAFYLYNMADAISASSIIKKLIDIDYIEVLEANVQY